MRLPSDNCPGVFLCSRADYTSGALFRLARIRRARQIDGRHVASKEIIMAQQDYTPHQQKIIKRYYDNQDTLMAQRLAELVGELYLSQGKKRQRAWANAVTA